MKDTQKSTVALLGIACMAFSLVAGVKLRDIVDIGRSNNGRTADLVTGRLVASTDDQVEIPASDYYYEISQLVKREYVEPIADEQKLAAGAVRGMIASLNDPNSLFMDKEEFAAYLNSREGKYEGIGVELALTTVGATNKQAVNGEGAEGSPEVALVTSVRIPRLKVVGITPGGPADRAGVKVGDLVYGIDGHWVVNTDLILKLQKANADFEAKRITAAQLNAVRTEVRQKTERALLPLRARDRLMLGKSGPVTVTWERAGIKRDTKIEKGVSAMPAEAVAADGAITLRFTGGSDAFLKRAIEGKRQVTIDLRNNALGDIDSMSRCLAVIAPNRTYGVIANDRNAQAKPVKITNGNPNPPAVKLLVDSTTRGAAEIFALALKQGKVATWSSPATGGDATVREIVRLPEGVGYTLLTGRYQPQATPGKLAMEERA